MIEIKAFIHRRTVAKVVHALGKAGYKNLSVIDVKGTLKSLSDDEQEYSIEIAKKVITEVKLELICEDAQRDEVISIIQAAANTGKPDAGRICVSELAHVYPIGEE
jgi:nitrogen regulatory protein P-II 1